MCGKAGTRRVAILGGIDEAGFGPLLGPLVVSSAVFSVPEPLAEADLWSQLRRSVGRTRRHLAGRLLIADSKKAFDRSQGLGHLERTVRAALRCLGHEPADVNGLLAVLCPDCLPRLNGYPWYQDLGGCPLPTCTADLRIASQVFADDLEACGGRVTALRSCCFDVGHFNRIVEQVRNKSQVLFIAAAQLIQQVLAACPDENVYILVDRQGGRAHYREHLLRSFPGMDLRILREGPDSSAYELHDGRRTVRLRFEVSADDHHLPVSLASMVSKYVRELLMERVNGHFARLDASLRPTAGYWKDGQRFVQEVRRRLPDLPIDGRLLIRSR